MIALILALGSSLTPPVPVPPPARTTPLPEYTADCRIVGRDGRAVVLRASVRGEGPARRIGIVTEAPSLRGIEGTHRPVTTIGQVGPNQNWSTSDVAPISLRGEDASLWLNVNSELADGVGIKIDAKRGQVPLYAGLCRAFSLVEGGPQ